MSSLDRPDLSWLNNEAAEAPDIVSCFKIAFEEANVVSCFEMRVVEGATPWLLAIGPESAKISANLDGGLQLKSFYCLPIIWITS